jgi:hypothetical protein
MQDLIDQGILWCARCEEPGKKDFEFCGGCGKRYYDAEPRDCPNADCKAKRVTTTFCPLCGTQVVTDYLLRWERGEVDLEAESAHAATIVDAIIKRHPSIGPQLREGYRESAEDLARAVNRGFRRES